MFSYNTVRIKSFEFILVRLRGIRRDGIMFSIGEDPYMLMTYILKIFTLL